MSESTSWIKGASVSDVAEGEAFAVEAQGLSLALYHVDGEWFCTENVCTHAFALLTEGWLEGHEIECPLHAGRFDIRTGKGLCAPIDEDLRTFAVRLDDDGVMVGLPGNGHHTSTTT